MPSETFRSLPLQVACRSGCLINTAITIFVYLGTHICGSSDATRFSLVKVMYVCMPLMTVLMWGTFISITLRFSNREYNRQMERAPYLLLTMVGFRYCMFHRIIPTTCCILTDVDIDLSNVNRYVMDKIDITCLSESISLEACPAVGNWT